jgi:hypothetical protein
MSEGQAHVDGFVEFQLAVQNRRKSRVGRALEHNTDYFLQAIEIAELGIQ